MNKFIGMTAGLECNGNGFVGKMIRIEYQRNADGSVSLVSVSGNTLARYKNVKAVVITKDQFVNRPTDPYNNIEEAQWALHQCGWRLMSEEYSDIE